ncbi:hypothetical protein SDC9_177434 [bioreactor metagenome]|uniref:Uncharacterized protein n=1 Tax=bioreactor metagenome TaxID=1076179 RepID=A0A645GSU2_9ZZZZ
MGGVHTELNALFSHQPGQSVCLKGSGVDFQTCVFRKASGIINSYGGIKNGAALSEQRLCQLAAVIRSSEDQNHSWYPRGVIIFKWSSVI